MAPMSPRCAADVVAQEGAEESNAASQGISILKEIFPDHGKEASSSTGKESQQFHTILGSVPSPTRAPFGTNTLPSGAPFGPPSHAPMPMAAPVMPPPPPVLPASACQEQWEQQRATGPLLSEPGFTSYRERLRAGGRGAFQRAIHAGLVPKSMKQEWGATQMSQARTPGILHASMDVQGLSYDGQQMWSGVGQMENSDYCSMPMAQYSQDYYAVQMQAPPTPGLNQMTQMSAQQMDPVMMQQMHMQQPLLPQMAVQQSMPQMQMMPMLQGEQSPVQMSVPQLSMQQLQLPPMAQVQTPTASGESTPAEIENVQRECLAMIMPHALGCDKNLLTAQLQAAAECQRYED